MLEFAIADEAVPMPPVREWAEGALDSSPRGDRRAYVVLSGVILMLVGRLRAGVAARRTA